MGPGNPVKSPILALFLVSLVSTVCLFLREIGTCGSGVGMGSGRGEDGGEATTISASAPCRSGKRLMATLDNRKRCDGTEVVVGVVAGSLRGGGGG